MDWVFLIVWKTLEFDPKHNCTTRTTIAKAQCIALRQRIEMHALTACTKMQRSSSQRRRFRATYKCPARVMLGQETAAVDIPAFWCALLSYYRRQH